VTERRLISSGSPLEDLIGYSRAVVDGDWVHVSGTTGFDYATMTISHEIIEQAEQSLANVGAALEEAGCTFADVVRVRYMLPDVADFEPCWPVLRRCFGEVHTTAGTALVQTGRREPSPISALNCRCRRAVEASGRWSLPYAAPAWRGGQPALGVA
jgi:enamine deaminase RidA (YjgF/YER057c/UK114 family)